MLRIQLPYCHPDYTSMEITMQGAFGAWGIHSGLITWISHPIKDISGVLAGLSNSAACSDMFRQAFDASKKVEMFVITSLAIYSCGGLSLRMQRIPGFLKGSVDHKERRMFESWHLLTIHDKKEKLQEMRLPGW